MEDLYFLNFKHVLVVLTAKDMRMNILNTVREQELDVNLKFVDSYIDGAKVINARGEHDPFDYIILNFERASRKINDFVEFVQDGANPNCFIEYTLDNKLIQIDLTK